jgi:hypothetical protein
MVFMVLVKKAESEGGSGRGFLCHVVDNVCVHGPVWLEVSSLRAPLWKERARSGWDVSTTSISFSLTVFGSSALSMRQKL